MKKIIVLLLLLSAAWNSFAQTAQDILKKAGYMVANKQYESAFKLLNGYDPNNQIPEIVLFKEDIALNFYVGSTMHQSFAFKDIPWNSDVMDYRGKAGTFNSYSFPIDNVLNSLIKVYPANYKLYNALGDYYANVELTYDDKWIVSLDSLHQLIKKNYQAAVDHNAGDDFSYYEIGYVNIAQGNYKESIPYFLKSIALNKDNPDAYYNLAYACLYTDDKDNALKYAKISLKLYEDSINQGDAARMIGEIYGEMKDTSDAIRFYEISDDIDSNNYNTLLPLLSLYAKANKKVRLNNRLDDFFYLDPENPTVYNDLADIFNGSKYVDILLNFYLSKLPEFSDNNKVTGNLYFYLAEEYLDMDKTVAKGYFLKARKAFDAIYSPDDEVFKAIEQGIDKTQ